MLRSLECVLCVSLGCVASCQNAPRAKSATVTTVEPPPHVDSPHTPPPRAVQPLRFPSGASTPPPGCFAKSEKLQSLACVVGRLEEEPDGKKTGVTLAIRFTGGGMPPPLPLVNGGLHETGRQSLDETMVEGEYVALEPPVWSSMASISPPSPFRIVVEDYRFRIEHSATLLHADYDHGIKRLPRRCDARAWTVGRDLVIEHTCRTLEEGWQVLEVEVLECSEKRCV